MSDSYERELRRVLRPNEKLIWSAPVSNSLLNKDNQQTRVSSYFLIATMLAFCVIGVYRIFQRITNPEASTALAIVGCILFVLGGLGLAFLFRRMRNGPSELNPFVGYAATDDRLIALGKDGALADEIRKDEMEDVAWVNDRLKDELLIIRTNDDECVRSFWIAHVDGLKDLNDMIYRNYIKAKR